MSVDQMESIHVLTPVGLTEQVGVKAGFTLRHGGVSADPYSSLNLGLSTGDDSASVLENRRRLFSKFGVSVDRLAIAGQVHGSDVRAVDEPGLYSGYDALVTKETDLVLCITAADCAVILLADPEARIIAACHSGWRGTVARIAQHTIDAMVKLGAAPERTRAYVSPCISADHFEVGPEVAEQFDDAFVVTGHSKPHIDLKAAIREQLFTAGLPKRHVDVSSRCTFAETSDFFSYRSEGTTGRMMGYICLTDA